MLPLEVTCLEIVNHLLTKHPELASNVKLMADKVTENIRLNQRYYGLNDLDRKLEQWLGYDGGYFVELGANNGIEQSNTYYFEKYRNWRGVLVEPTPHNYLACLRDRSQETRVFCNACTSFDYAERFVEIAYSNLMSSPVGLESDIADPHDHAREGKKFLNASDDNFSFGALATPLNALLLKANAPMRMDLLSLDVEGAEIEVLKGIDHSHFRFKYLCIESRSKDKLDAYLAENQYVFVEQISTIDCLYRDDRATTP